MAGKDFYHYFMIKSKVSRGFNDGKSSFQNNPPKWRHPVTAYGQQTSTTFRLKRFAAEKNKGFSTGKCYDKVTQNLYELLYSKTCKMRKYFLAVLSGFVDLFSNIF